MDKDAMTIQWMDRIIEAIDAFRWSGVPDDVKQYRCCAGRIRGKDEIRWHDIKDI